MAEEFRKYDTDCKYTGHNVRLAADAEVKENEYGQMVRLKFVDSSRSEGDADMWIDATATDRDADKAAFLKKGDVLSVEGKLTFHRFGDDGTKVGFRIRRAELHVPVSLFQTLKERGFVPGAKGSAPKGKAAPPIKKPAAAKRAVDNLDDE